MNAAWPDALRFGCEAAGQLADAEVTGRGTLQLFWFADPAHHRVTVEVIPGTHGEPPAAKRVETAARHIAAADGTLLLMDGLRFPCERFLGDLRRNLLGLPSQVAGGLASQREPVTRAGARVFLGERVLPAACLVVNLHGVAMRVEVMRGWIPASPIYTVTRAEGSVAHEIDGEPATDWYRRFFSVGGQIAPMPESATRFPLIVEGPRPERQGLYRLVRAFDEPPGAVTFWGGLETGDRVRLGIATDEPPALPELTAGLPADAALLYSCVGGHLALGDRAGREVAALHGALGGVPLSGCFTFGEIGPSLRGHLAVYNQTSILVLLREVGP